VEFPQNSVNQKLLKLSDSKIKLDVLGHCVLVVVVAKAAATTIKATQRLKICTRMIFSSLKKHYLALKTLPDSIQHHIDTVYCIENV